MSLVQYKKKRSFGKTPEPSGKKSSSSSRALRFVVQKHDASRLHYDFRLEMEGVLKSWAIPKGPSLNPDDKRLAMMVEDHPNDYRSFEGIIPEGNYGAGTVIVWDEGTYESLEPVEGGIKQQEKTLLKQLREGNLKFRLHGKKLNGDYALVHLKGREENAWLLIKKKDKYSSTKDVTKKDESVKSGKTLAQVEADKNSKQWGRSKVTDATPPKVKSATRKRTPVSKKKSPVKRKNKRPASQR
jgi:bifunctional non-homologous end joining protein LigD